MADPPLPQSPGLSGGREGGSPREASATWGESSSAERRLRFCSLRELRERRRVTRWVDVLRDELTALLLPEGRIIVTSSVCVHMGGEFDVDWEKRQLCCRWHDWRYDIDSGDCLTFALPGRRLRHYPHVVEGDDLLVMPIS